MGFDEGGVEFHRGKEVTQVVWGVGRLVVSVRSREEGARPTRMKFLEKQNMYNATLHFPFETTKDIQMYFGT